MYMYIVVVVVDHYVVGVEVCCQCFCFWSLKSVESKREGKDEIATDVGVVLLLSLLVLVLQINYNSENHWEREREWESERERDHKLQSILNLIKWDKSVIIIITISLCYLPGYNITACDNNNNW